jgi:hypothetical protein
MADNQTTPEIGRGGEQAAADQNAIPQSTQRVRIVPFPQEAVDTVECAVTGEQIPAVLVARWSATVGHVYCPACSGRRGERIWHEVELS